MMAKLPSFKPFNFPSWIESNKQFLKPPVSNKQLFDTATDMVVMIVGGPNMRVDFHDDPVEEFFYQLKGDMLLKLVDNGEIVDVPIREGEVYLIPPHLRHSPQRPQEDSIGLVVEGTRQDSMRDGFEWFCFDCGALIHRVEVQLKDIVKDLPPLFEAFYASENNRTCNQCGSLHPGKGLPPDGWAAL